MISLYSFKPNYHQNIAFKQYNKNGQELISGLEEVLNNSHRNEVVFQNRDVSHQFALRRTPDGYDITSLELKNQKLTHTIVTLNTDNKRTSVTSVQANQTVYSSDDPEPREKEYKFPDSVDITNGLLEIIFDRRILRPYKQSSPQIDCFADRAKELCSFYQSLLKRHSVDPMETDGSIARLKIESKPTARPVLPGTLTKLIEAMWIQQKILTENARRFNRGAKIKP